MKRKVLYLLSVAVFTCIPLCVLTNDTIKVSTVNEFLQALGSNRTILMQPGVYLLSEWNPYSEGKTTSLPRGVKWSSEHDGGELVLNGFKNLTIRGEGKDNVQIIVHPRYVYVLRFIACTDIVLENLYAGHSEGGYCQGGVFAFENSSRISLTGVNMYGSGTEGLMMNNVSDMTVTGSSIFECTYYIMSVFKSKNIAFNNCLFFDNKEFSLVNVDKTKNMTFENCTFILNSGKMFSVEGDTISVYNSYFLNNDDPDYRHPNVALYQCVFEKDVYQAGKVLGNRVNMRILPNTDSAIKRQLEKGSMIYMIRSHWSMQSTFLWYLVCHEGECGWAYGEFLQFARFTK